MADRIAAVVDELGKVAGVNRSHAKNADAAMTTMPAASPSRPSMRLMALTITRTHSTVRGTATSDPSDTTPCVGNQKKSSWTLLRIRIPAASTCPAIFAGADSVLTSSTRPTNVMARAANSAP